MLLLRKLVRRIFSQRISVILTSKMSHIIDVGPLNCLLTCARRKYKQLRNFFLQRKSQTYAENMTSELQRVLLPSDIVALQILYVNFSYAWSECIISRSFRTQYDITRCDNSDISSMSNNSGLKAITAMMVTNRWVAEN